MTKKVLENRQLKPQQQQQQQKEKQFKQLSGLAKPKLMS
jgi:hypothetical protein